MGLSVVASTEIGSLAMKWFAAHIVIIVGQLSAMVTLWQAQIALVDIVIGLLAKISTVAHFVKPVEERDSS